MPDDLFDEEEFQDPAPERGQVLPQPNQQSVSAETRELDIRQPLADRLRPHTFDDYVGQQHLVGDEAALRQLIKADRVPSVILWGPPGTGKTTLASLIARETDSDFIVLSAVTSGIKDVRTVISHAKVNRQYARRTILFVDEIHRFNKAQQDAFLPHVESGLITLIGATTENPSFTVVAALLSRCRVFTLKSLDVDDVRRVLLRGAELLSKQFGNRPPLVLPEETIQTIFRLSDGDARRGLTILEASTHIVMQSAPIVKGEDGEPDSVPIPKELIENVAQQTLLYDRNGEEHYNLISALHKTVRSSDPHGAVYWANRMLKGGEDPRYLIRRLIRMAGEDIGLADPRAIEQAVACQKAYETLGSPEGDLFITQLVAYLAVAPKSNALYSMHKMANQMIEETGTLPVPNHLRNAPTKLMKDSGYGEDYTYDHDYQGHFAPKQGLPDSLKGTELYKPSDEGSERKISERLTAWDKARKKHLDQK